MKNKSLFIILIFLLIPVISSANYNPSWNWKTIQTENFTIYYPEGHEQFAQRILSLSDEVYEDVTKYFGMKPPKCPIILNPGTDLFNGFYSAFPNRISLFETPAFYLRGFGPGSDIADTVFTHEFTHFVHITATAGWYKNLTKILGRGTTISNILSPGWVIEGITTNTETMFTDGGRGRCSYFRGQIMSCTEDEGLWNLSAAGVASPYKPPGSRFYLAGYHMVKFLNNNYGKDAFAKLSRYQAKHPIGGTAEAIKFVTGKNASDFYKEFLDDFQVKTDQIKQEALKSGLPQGATILSEKYESITSHFWTEDNTILALRSGYDKKNTFLEIDPLTSAVINEFNTGRINALPPVRSLNNNGDIVFSGFYPHSLSNGQLTSTDITIFNTNDKNFKRVTKDLHIYSADVSPDNSRFVATRRNEMWIDLVLMDTNGNNIKPLISKKGYLFEDPEWSPDGEQIVSVVKIGQNSDIALIDSDSGIMKLLFTTDVYEDNDPSFSPDGQWIVFSSNRKDVWNIFAWNLKEKELFQLTSVFYGATEPRISPDGNYLSFLSLHHGVNTLCTMEFNPKNGKKLNISINENNENPEINKPDLQRVNPEVTFTPSGFPILEAYAPYLHIPYFQNDEDSFTLGLWVQGGDPVGINSYSASIFHKTVSDISNTADTSEEADPNNYIGYDISLMNNSFWPTLIARASENIENGGVFWYKERLVELAAEISIINRIIPDQITTSIMAGGRYRHLSSLDEQVSFINTGNDSTSLFGEINISRSPDFARRDIIPTCGQQLFIEYEKDINNIGGERSSRNAILSINQFLPSLIKHHGFEFKGVHQEQKGLPYSKDLSLPRGFSRSDIEGGLNLKKNILLAGEYHFPISYPDVGLGLSALHFNAFKGSVFFDWGAGWDDKFDYDELKQIGRKSVGGSFTCRASIFTIFNIETGVEGGYKIEEEESFMNFILLVGF